MPEKTLAVANYFLERGKRENIAIDPLKLQKLVYFAHGWHLAVTGEPLLDENVEAWPYGPVIPTIYHEFKRYGGSAITSLAVDFAGGEVYSPQVTNAPLTRSILDRVWREYKRHSAVQLSNISHEPNSPWHTAWNNPARQGKLRGIDIPDREIQRYFIEAGLRRKSHG